MKCVIVGVDVIESFMNKKTGKEDSAVVLQMMNKSSRVYGVKVRSPFIAQSSPLFKVLRPFASDPSELINYVCECEFNDKFIEELELIEKLDHDVINW